MAGYNECPKRSGDARKTSASPLKRLGAPNALLLALVFLLGSLNYGWIFYPPLGTISGLINAGIITTILIAGLCSHFVRKIF